VGIFLARYRPDEENYFDAEITLVVIRIPANGEFCR
jgi:hypothetical protein